LPAADEFWLASDGFPRAHRTVNSARDFFLRLLIELCWFTHSRAWNSRNIGCADCQGNWKNKEKIFLYFFLANKSEKDYENSFRILREKFFSCMDSPDCSNSVVLVAEPSGKVLLRHDSQGLRTVPIWCSWVAVSDAFRTCFWVIHNCG